MRNFDYHTATHNWQTGFCQLSFALILVASLLRVAIMIVIFENPTSKIENRAKM
jgi:hypothetical protein